MLENLISFYRKTGDEYFFDICQNVCHSLIENKIDFNLIYGHVSGPLKLHVKYNNLVLFFPDRFDVEDFFLEVAKAKNTKILLFSSQLDSEHVESDNLQIINCGPNFLFQKTLYQNLTGQQNKLFQSDKHWVSLSLHPRVHRAIAAVFLKGLGWDQYGELRLNPCLFHDFDTWYEFSTAVGPHYRDNLDEYRYIFEKGFNLYKKNSAMNFSQSNEIYPNLSIDNAGNFDRNLRHIYKYTTTEIVNETTFDTVGYLCTEKFLNSVYGFNIPIILGPRYIVRYLENQGFDMLTDIVDTSYDAVPSPGMRLVLAIEKNKDLLTNREQSIKIWQSVLPRLNANYEFAKTCMHNSIRDKVYQKFSDAIWWLKQN